MPLHTTKDPVQRAHDIANHEEQVFSANAKTLDDWLASPYHGAEVFDSTLKEMFSTGPNENSDTPDAGTSL